MSSSKPPVSSTSTVAPSLVREGDCFVGRFTAMAGPCEILIDTDDRAAAAALHRIAAIEAGRIERKFSRYRTGNIIHRINNAGGAPVAVDEETALLIRYAVTCYEMSGGLFDITSGVLRRVWRFDGGSQVPTTEAVDAVLEHVGWHRVEWNGSTLQMPPGMEIDLGGLGKEYAVDRVAALVRAQTRHDFLVNFGGDLFASGPRQSGRGWHVAVDDPEQTGKAVRSRLDLTRGGMATSGDARRYVLWNGKRLGHILNPKTGWPVEGAPRSITVVADICLEAGTLATLAALQGPGAAAFLDAQGVEFWLA